GVPMRMSVRSRIADERGVSGVIVAVAIVMLLGMLGLSVDGGGFLLKRRQVVNAADSAALSYGVSCIQGKSDASASTDATTTATGNASDATLDSATPANACSAGHVTVRYHGSQPRYFLPVLGMSSSGTVSSTASAAWGGAGGAITPPIEVTQGGIQNCN